MTLPPCPRCNVFDTCTDGEYFLFCLQCGWMPNEDGYSSRAHAARAWQNAVRRISDMIGAVA